jgi:hypothetical protein
LGAQVLIGDIMAYGDYVNAATLLDTCDADTGDTPGKSLDCKFLGQSEEATTDVANRPHLALAENMDNLKIPLDSQVAITQVAPLTAFSGTTITIDPTGGAADISFSSAGYLYTGNVSYSDTQENRDTLYQLLDEDYNEVMVEGEEVKVASASPAGADPGNGFYNTGLVTLTLNKSVPSGNYRFSYSRESTLATLPDDALIRADIRGIHEGAAESAKPTMIICAPAGERGDYVGASALEDAISDIGASGNKVIFLKAGTYDLPTGTTTIEDGVTVLGEARRASGGAVIRFTAASASLVLSPYANLESVRVTATTPDGSQNVYAACANGSVHNVTLDGVDLQVDADGAVFDNVVIDPYSDALTIYSAVNTRFAGVSISEPTVAPASGRLVHLTATPSCNGMYVNGLSVSAPNTNTIGLELSAGASVTQYRIKFQNCDVEVAEGAALELDCWIQEATFENCIFKSETTVVDTGSSVDIRDINFIGCRFENTATTWYRVLFARLLCARPDGPVSTYPTSLGIVLENCHFLDSWCTGHTDPADPGGTPTAGSAFPVMELKGVSGQRVTFERDMTYNVEDSPWLIMTNSRIEYLTVHTGDSGMAPFDYGTYSSGIIEILEQSYVKHLKFLESLDGEVHRAVVYIYNENDHRASVDKELCIPAEIDGLQIAFDDATAWWNQSPPYTGGLALTMAGNTIVRNFHWNADTRFAKRNDAGSVDDTACLVLMKGRYNTLDNPQMAVSGDRGSVWYPIYIGPDTGHEDHCNVIRGGKISINFVAAIDPSSTYFPESAIRISNGSGAHIDGLTVYLDVPPAATHRAMYIAGHFTRVTSNHIDCEDCALETDVINFATTEDVTCICVGNIIRDRVTTPTIGGSPVAAGNNLIIDVLAEPTS